MMRLRSSSAAVSIVSMLCILASAPVQCIAAPDAPAARPTLEDSGSWRRKNPFIESGKNGSGSATARSTLSKTDVKIPKQIPAEDLNVQGIFQADRKFYALINGRAVKAGEVIDGFTIKEIHRYSIVVLNEHKEKFTYDIYQGRIDRGRK